MKTAFSDSAAGAQNGAETVIFLDLDGVIADFDTHLKTQGKAKADGSPRWDALDHAWFATIPVVAGAKEFYRTLTTIGTVKFLTAPTMSTGSISGKAEWIQSSFLPERGKWALGDFIIAPSKDKRFLAGPGRILIDDRIRNIEEWQAAGGIGIHHAGDFADTLRRVREAAAGAAMPEIKPQAPAP